MAGPGNAARPRGFVAVVTTFPVFWWIAFVSQATAGALTTCLSWYIGSPALPVWTPLLNQIVALVLTSLGAWIGHRLSHRLDLAAIIALCSGGQGLVVLILLLARIDASGAPRDVWLLIVVAGLLHLLVGAAGPAWVVLVSRWPGSGLESSELLRRESAQFQLANFLGPLAGGALLAATEHALAIAAVADAVTWCVIVAYFLTLRRNRAYDRQPVSRAPDAETGDLDPRDGSATLRRSRVGLLVAVSALSIAIDAPRAYLARLLQSSGGGEYLFGWTLAVGALAAAAAGLFGGRLTARWGEPARAAIGMVLAVAGIGGWITATDVGWIVGAAGIGAGTGLASASITTMLIDAAPARAVGSIAIMGVLRRTVGVVGGLVIVGALALGIVPLLPSLIAGLVGIAVVARRAVRPPSAPASVPDP